MAEAPEMQLLNSSSVKPSSQDSFDHQTQAPAFNGLNLPNGDIPFSAFMYPGIFPPQQDQEPMDRGPGLYAVPVHPFMQPIVGIPSNALIPFTYNLPTTSPVIREAVQPVDPPEQQQLQQQQQQQVGPAGRRVVVREFRIAIAIQIDLWLFIKLATAVYMLSRDGSRQRLVFLSFLAVIFYLYRTGALAPTIRRLKRRMRRVVGPHHPPQRAAFRANNLPADVARGDENAGIAGGGNANRATENEDAGDAAAQGEAGNNRLWRIMKEIQIIVVGFVASLIPGFYND